MSVDVTVDVSHKQISIPQSSACSATRNIVGSNVCSSSGFGDRKRISYKVHEMMPLEDRSPEVEPDTHIKASSSNEGDPENEEIAGG